MKNRRLEDAPNVTHNVGKSQGFIGISIRYVETIPGESERELHTEWEFNADEMTRLLLGAPLRLIMLAVQHPPIRFEVGEVPNLDEAVEQAKALLVEYEKKGGRPQ